MFQLQSEWSAQFCYTVAFSFVVLFFITDPKSFIYCIIMEILQQQILEMQN